MGKEETDLPLFRERMKELREQKGMTVNELASAARVTEGAIRQIESGQTKQARIRTGLRIAKALNVSPWWLAGEDEPADAGPAHIKNVTRLGALAAPVDAEVHPEARYRSLEQTVKNLGLEMERLNRGLQLLLKDAPPEAEDQQEEPGGQ